MVLGFFLNGKWYIKIFIFFFIRPPFTATDILRRISNCRDHSPVIETDSGFPTFACTQERKKGENTFNTLLRFTKQNSTETLRPQGICIVSNIETNSTLCINFFLIKIIPRSKIQF